jgi:hypothetical protein
VDGVTRLNRQETQGDDPLTREYVNAGLVLVEEALDHGPAAGVDGHPFLSWISQRKVVDAVNKHGQTPTPATVASLRDRWQPHGNYLWDLIDHIRARRPSRSFPERARDLIKAYLASRSSPAAVVREFGRGLQEGVFDNEFLRIQLLGLAVVGSSKSASVRTIGSVSDIYTEIDQRWMGIIDQFLHKYDLEYRVGVSQANVIQLGMALTEGFALRELADPTDGPRREERLRLHSTGLLSLLFSLTVPEEEVDGNVSIDKAVNAMVERSSGDER